MLEHEQAARELIECRGIEPGELDTHERRHELTDALRVRVEADSEPYELANGSVVIAAITSCTNTSNPSVLTAAGLRVGRDDLEISRDRIIDLGAGGLRIPPAASLPILAAYFSTVTCGTDLINQNKERAANNC